MLKDQAFMEILKQGALKKAKTFSKENVIPIYEDLYDRVLKQHRA
jgi:hypothetical protein